MTDKTLSDEPTIDSPPSTWVPTLTLVSGKNQGGSAVIKRDHFTIGRSRGTDLKISDKAVSRIHAEINLKDGRYLLKDLKSKWGTYLNGQKIEEAEIKFGDEIAIGGNRLVFNLAPEGAQAKGGPNWRKIAVYGLIFATIATTATLFYSKYQTRVNMDRPGGDVLSEIIYHYDKGISYYNQLNTNNTKEMQKKAIDEMKKVISLDPDAKTRFSRSARRIIDGLEK